MYLKMILAKDPSPECTRHFFRLHFHNPVWVPKQRKPEFSCLSPCFLCFPCFPLGVLFTQVQKCVCAYVQPAFATYLINLLYLLCVVFQWQVSAHHQMPEQDRKGAGFALSCTKEVLAAPVQWPPWEMGAEAISERLVQDSFYVAKDGICWCLSSAFS